MKSSQPSRSVNKTNTSTRARRAPEKPPQPVAAPQFPQESLSPEEAIRRRAHEIYLERGCSRGDDLGDWLQAEREYWHHRGWPAKARWRGPHS